MLSSLIPNGKINFMKTFFILFFILNIFSHSLFSAESGPTKPSRGFHLALGLGVAMKNNMRKDNTYNNTHGDLIFSPIPLIQIGWGPISFGGQGLKLDLYGNRQWGIYTNIDRNRDRYRGTGMDDRRDSWFWGIGGRYGKFSTQIARDIQGRSKGKKFNFNYSEMYTIKEKFFTRSAIGVECLDQNYADYYYGVKKSEATAWRPEYHPGRLCQPTLSFAPMYKMNENITFITALSLKYLARDIQDSPTIKGGNTEAGLIFGSLWQF